MRSNFESRMEFREVFADEAGYAELKKHMRQTAEFSISMLAIFQERADIETTYAKSIAKLSAKALKCNKDSTGSLMDAWNLFCEHLNQEVETHKAAADSLHEDVFKKLKTHCDTHAKNRKASEAGVDKSCKIWHDKCNELHKAKKATHVKTKESEGMQVVLDDPMSKGKVLSDKELGKLQSKSKKANDVATRADTEYLNLIKLTERTRHDFEKVLRQAATTMEKLEKERIEQQRDVLLSYVACVANMQPTKQKHIETMIHGFTSIDATNDVMVIAQQKGRQPDSVSQLLYDSYEEDLNNSMTLNRRRQSLHSKLHAIDAEIQKETKAKKGIARLSGVYAENPNYADNKTQDDVTQQLTHSEEMLNMLRACKFKLTAALALMDKRPQPSDDISSYIKTEKKKQQGVHVSILKMPKLVAPLSPVTEVDGRGMGDGAHMQSASPTEPKGNDEFDNMGSQDVIGQCIVRFDYEALESEEISIHEGDIVNIIEKHDDGWWHGEVAGKRGNFPGSYVDLL